MSLLTCPFRFSSFMMGAASNYSLMYVLSAPETSKVPIARWETHVLLVVCRAAVSGSRMAEWPSHCAPSVGTQLAVCVLMLKSSHRPMGNSRFALCLQGGGVAVYGGTVTISSCTISGNTATGVRAHTQHLPSPHVVKRFSCQPYTKVTTVTSHPLLPTQGPNVYVIGDTVCSWLTTLTNVTGTVSTCRAPPPPPSPQSPPFPPSPPSPPPLPPGGVVAVSTVTSLLGALANTAVARIVLAPGTYNLTTELNITRSLILEAAVAGTVILDARASTFSQRRVLKIGAVGSLRVVQVIGLNITGGYSSEVCAQARKFLYCSLYLSDYIDGRLTLCSGDSRFARCLQGGGGVFVLGGTVAISSCTISGNTASSVRAHDQKFASPHG
jgi:hypothetical protein